MIYKILIEKQQDLILEYHIENSIQYINQQTLIKAMKQPNVAIYDCRYKYEYQGEHIIGAIHLNHSINQFEELFCPNRQTKKIVVLNCEFSQKEAKKYILRLKKKIEA